MGFRGRAATAGIASVILAASFEVGGSAPDDAPNGRPLILVHHLP